MNLNKVIKIAIKEAISEESVEYPITLEIMDEYEEIRQSGVTNMIDMTTVQDEAHRYGYEELEDFISEYGSKGYYYLLQNYSELKNKFSLE